MYKLQRPLMVMGEPKPYVDKLFEALVAHQLASSLHIDDQAARGDTILTEIMTIGVICRRLPLMELKARVAELDDRRSSPFLFRFSEETLKI